MKRTLTASAIAIAVCVLGVSAVPAASPQVDKAIKTIQSIGSDAAKMKLFCALDDADEAVEAAGGKEDPAAEKQADDILSQLGADFAAAWDVGAELDEKSPDAAEFAAAVDALSEKCP
jgi:hypothetical protein